MSQGWNSKKQVSVSIFKDAAGDCLLFMYRCCNCRCNNHEVHDYMGIDLKKQLRYCLLESHILKAVLWLRRDVFGVLHTHLNEYHVTLSYFQLPKLRVRDLSYLTAMCNRNSHLSMMPCCQNRIINSCGWIPQQLYPHSIRSLIRQAHDWIIFI